MAEARGFSLLERFELKYHIPVEWADAIGEFLKPYCEEDYYSKITPGGFYYITNLYLDSPKWTFLGWKKKQLLDRFNMRIRTYGEHPAQDGTFHFARSAAFATRAARLSRASTPVKSGI